MHIAFIVFTVIIIFPIFINGFLIFSLDNKKAYFTVNLFKIIKLFSGYIEIIKDGIALHVSEAKAIIIPFKSFVDMGKKFKPLKDYHILTLKTKIDLGIKNNMLAAGSITFFMNYIDNFLRWFFYNIKPYLKIDNEISIYEGQNKFNLYVELSLVLNLLMIILSLLKIIMEKLIYAISNRKQQNLKSN